MPNLGLEVAVQQPTNICSWGCPTDDKRRMCCQENLNAPLPRNLSEYNNKSLLDMWVQMNIRLIYKQDAGIKQQDVAKNLNQLDVTCPRKLIWLSGATFRK